MKNISDIKEEYVSFETAILLYKKGFNIPCNSYFIEDNEIALINHRRDFNNNGIYISAPTKQVVMRWLREVHNLHICVTPYDIEQNYVRYIPEIYTLPNKGHELNVEGMNVCINYEDAAEAAINYCLKNLI